jgi:Fe(3+) dicitrate transport protein
VNQLENRGVFDVLTNPEDPTNAGYLAVLRGEVDSATPAETLLIGPNDREFVSQGLQTVLGYERATGPLSHRLEVGARLHYDEIRRRHSQSGFLMVSGELEPDGGPEQVTTSNTDSTYALALHAIDALTWRSLTFTPGVRVELVQSRNENRITQETNERALAAVMPGAGVYWALTQSFGLLGGVYRGFSPPPPGSDEHISPEYSVNYETGARFSQRHTRLELIGFYNDYQNLTDICTLSSGCLSDDLDRQFDAGRARIYGAEAFAGHTLDFGALKLPLTVAYTYTRANFSSTFSSQDPIYGDVVEDDEIPYVPRHQLNATLAAELERASAYVSFGYVARMRETAGQEALKDTLATDRQTWVDVGAQARVIGPLRIYGNLRNVLDERDIVSRRPYGARPNAPRWLQVGAKVDL